MARRDSEFQTIGSGGGLLPPDLLRKVLDPQAKLEGTAPGDYGLPPGERLNEGITQSWNRLRKHWAEFRAAAKNLPTGEPGTGLTNDKWSVPLLRELSFGLLPTSTAPTIDGKVYAINRFFGATAIHLVGCGLSLDRRTAGARGAAAANPHGLLQDFLNRSPANLWGILSNGLALRVLRDTQAISRQSYLEFDLEAMFDGEVFSDFVLMWLITHATRFAAREDGYPESCWLERWTKIAEEQGTRALGDLQGNVERALQILGQGFVGHSKNAALRDALRSGQLAPSDFHGQLLRVVYRLIFLFVAEDRTLDGMPLLHARDHSDSARIARERYATHYSAGRLRELAGEIRGSRHGDLWRQFNIVVGALSVDERFARAREQLALPILGSLLWSVDSTEALNAQALALSGGTELSNADFLEAIQNLAFTRQHKSLRPVDYKNLGAEELGGVYESLLALTPQVSGDGAKFAFAEFAGNERKTSGSYYTPESLVQCLLDSALEPVVEGAVKGKKGGDAEDAILAIKVCDPAVGSGHFLVGAAHRLALHLARIRAAAQGEGEPSPGFYQHALRDVVGHCLYGVDINPMAAELCRVGLWLEALDPGKPLSFLDHHIRVGNSLLGTTPRLIADGLPDGAFDAIEGDEKKVCAQLKKRNKAERDGFDQQDLLGLGVPSVTIDLSEIAAEAGRLDATSDDTIGAVQKKAYQFRRLVGSPEYMHAQHVSDAWCAVFVWPKTTQTLNEIVTTGQIKRFASDAKALTGPQTVAIALLAQQYQFFHWDLEFPEVFKNGGFDCVLGNPPWERVNVEARQFFAKTHPQIAAAGTAERRRLLESIATNEPETYQSFREAQRQASSEISFFQNSGIYPHLNQARLNTYLLFVEIAVRISNRQSYSGVVTPSGIVTDDTSKEMFRFLMESNRLVRLVDFENREGLFPGVDSRYRLSLITIRGIASTYAPIFYFFLHNPEQVSEAGRQFSLTPDDLLLLSPLSGLCPTLRYARDRDLVIAIYRRTETFVVSQEKQKDWTSSDFLIMYRSDDSSHLYRTIALSSPDLRGALTQTVAGEQYVPVWESKYIHQFDHRHASFPLASNDEFKDGALVEVPAEQKDEVIFPVPRHWAPLSSVSEILTKRRWNRQWFVGYRDITNATNERTAIAAALPLGGASQPLNLFLPESPMHAVVWIGAMNSYVLDYVVRQRIGGLHLNITTCRQLPIASPLGIDPRVMKAIRDIVLELTYTSPALGSFALDCEHGATPYHWDEARRSLLRAELDATFFLLYLPSDSSGDWVKQESESDEDLRRLKTSFRTPRHAIEYIMETFPIVQKKDIARFGDYRTKLQILDIYDEMQNAMKIGVEYKTRLDPPPADPRCCHPARDAASVSPPV